MNFDNEDDDADFNFGTTNNNKLASLFKTNTDSNATNESLKYKPPKKPAQKEAPATSASTSSNSQSSSVLFFSGVQVFKYINNRYDPQGKLGLALLSSQIQNQNQYRILLYVTKTQPVATIKIGHDFKLAIQKNNYASFYDENKQLWSVLFDNEDLVITFATQITLCKCNLLNGNVENVKLYQDLKNNDSDSNPSIEQGDSIEIGTSITLWKDYKLGDVIENTMQKPNKVKLGKNKLPQHIEDLIIGLKQSDRRLFVISGSLIQSFYPSNISSNSVVFFDINILRIKKNTKERSNSNAANNDQIMLPQLNQNYEETESRSRSDTDTIKDKAKNLSDQSNDPKLEKAKLISRMAKMGQQMLPQNITNDLNENDDDWEKSSSATNETLKAQANLTNMQNIQLNTLQEATAASNLLLQQRNQQLQQQLTSLQNQQFSMQPNPLVQAQSNNQIALFKNLNSAINNPQLYTQPQLQSQINLNNPVENKFQQPIQTFHVAQSQEIDPKFLNKLDTISEKLDQIRSITQINNQNLPNMETNILLQNIQRIVRENEEYKKELFEKSSKIDEQNKKITELLMKAQSYVEQSHQILEQKNNSFQNNAEKNALRVLELEQDKMRLTADLSKLTGQISELNLEINKMQKSELEIRQQLREVSANTDTHKQNSERLLLENADLQTKLDTALNDLKKEKQTRKNAEIKLQSHEDEINELKQSQSTNLKLLDEKKRKYEQDRFIHENELEELKKTHTNEINLLKEKITRMKNNANESQSEQLKQIEIDLNSEWQIKLDKSVLQIEQKYQNILSVSNEEKELLQKQLDDCKEAIKSYKYNQSKYEKEIDRLKQNLDESSVYKEKLDRLQSQAVLMKERYETRIKELIDAEPDTEVIGEEVKKLMNAMYRKLKSQIKPEQYYVGNGILTAMLKIIKMVTLQVLHDTEEEEVDYFSEHIYKSIEAATKIEKEQDKEVLAKSISKEEIPEITEIKAETNTSNVVQENLTNTNATLVDSNQTKIINNKNFETNFENKPEINEENSKENLVQDFADEEKKENHENEASDNINPHLNKFAEEKSPNCTNDDDDDDDDDIQLINEEEQTNYLYTKDTSSEVLKTDDKIGYSNSLEISSRIQTDTENIETDSALKEKEFEEETTEKQEVIDQNDGNIETKNNLDIEVPDDNLKERNDITEDLNEKDKQSEVIKETTNKTNVMVASKSLFDDESDDENDKLFSFTSNEVKSNTSKNETETTESKPVSSLSMKFSPPPLFEDDQNDEKEDIDWFN